MLGIRVNRLIMGGGGRGTRACTLRYAVWSDVTLCDVVDPRPGTTRYFGCTQRMSDTVTCIGPAPCPTARHEPPNDRRAPPPAHGRLRRRSPSAKGPPRIRRHEHPATPAGKSGGEAQPRGCAIWVRRPPPSFESSGRPRAATASTSRPCVVEHSGLLSPWI